MKRNKDFHEYKVFALAEVANGPNGMKAAFSWYLDLLRISDGFSWIRGINASDVRQWWNTIDG